VPYLRQGRGRQAERPRAKFRRLQDIGRGCPTFVQTTARRPQWTRPHHHSSRNQEPTRATSNARSLEMSAASVRDASPSTPVPDCQIAVSEHFEAIRVPSSYRATLERVYGAPQLGSPPAPGLHNTRCPRHRLFGRAIAGAKAGTAQCVARPPAVGIDRPILRREERGVRRVAYGALNETLVLLKGPKSKESLHE
jgi:hypothetical protein